MSLHDGVANDSFRAPIKYTPTPRLSVLFLHLEAFDLLVKGYPVDV
jgi:hypothetical protein